MITELAHRRAWTPPGALSGELLAMLVEAAREARAPYRVLAPKPARPPASTVAADRLQRKYRMALL